MTDSSLCPDVELQYFCIDFKPFRKFIFRREDLGVIS